MLNYGRKANESTKRKIPRRGILELQTIRNLPIVFYAMLKKMVKNYSSDRFFTLGLRTIEHWLLWFLHDCSGWIVECFPTIAC